MDYKSSHTWVNIFMVILGLALIGAGLTAVIADFVPGNQPEWLKIFSADQKASQWRTFFLALAALFGGLIALFVGIHGVRKGKKAQETLLGMAESSAGF